MKINLRILPLYLSLILVLSSNGLISAQTSINYEISFPNYIHHEAEVSISYDKISQEPLQLRMSMSSPGRYALHQFAKNVYNLKAVDHNNNDLEIVRIEPDVWEVKKHNGYVKVSYTLYADRADGTYSQIDETHAHMNMPATFMWARKLEHFPITIQFNMPEGLDWKVATQLIATNKPNEYKAPDFYYFMDSPTSLSNFHFQTWEEIGPDGKPITFELAVNHPGKEKDVEKYAKMIEKVTKEQGAIFGEFPKFDYGRYTFIADYQKGNNGDAMEHRNSTFLVSSNELKGNAKSRIGSASHELFHAWNMERLRSSMIEPFNFENWDMSDELWFGEGFTSYYGNLALVRSEIKSIDEFASYLSRIMNTVLNSPGSKKDSPIEMSKRAAFKDAAVSVDPNNFANNFVSYYSYGSAVAIALELELRSKFENLSLDDYMKALWQKYGRTEITYNNHNLEMELIALTKDSVYGHDFFKKHVYGAELADYTSLLALVGFQLRKVNEGKTYLGSAKLSFKDGKCTIISNTIIGSPLYIAGLEREDVIVSIDGVKLGSNKILLKVLASYQPGKQVKIKYVNRKGHKKETTITLLEDINLEVKTFESLKIELTEEVKSFRDNWLDSKVK